MATGEGNLIFCVIFRPELPAKQGPPERGADRRTSGQRGFWQRAEHVQRPWARGPLWPGGAAARSPLLSESAVKPERLLGRLVPGEHGVGGGGRAVRMQVPAHLCSARRERPVGGGRLISNTRGLGASRRSVSSAGSAWALCFSRNVGRFFPFFFFEKQTLVMLPRESGYKRRPASGAASWRRRRARPAAVGPTTQPGRGCPHTRW